jgi:hypothetical protein
MRILQGLSSRFRAVPHRLHVLGDGAESLKTKIERHHAMITKCKLLAKWPSMKVCAFAYSKLDMVAIEFMSFASLSLLRLYVSFYLISLPEACSGGNHAPAAHACRDPSTLAK